MKGAKRTSFIILAILIGCVMVLALVAATRHILYSTGYLEDPQRILQEYQIGSLRDELPKEGSILKEYEGPLDAVAFIIRGYEPPRRNLKSGERLIVVDRGEWVVFVYFDSQGTVVSASISGS